MSYIKVQKTPEAYNGIAGAPKLYYYEHYYGVGYLFVSNFIILYLPVTALHPSKAPQLKVKPKNNCGQKVILFIKGYVTTSSIDDAPNKILFFQI